MAKYTVKGIDTVKGIRSIKQADSGFLKVEGPKPLEQDAFTRLDEVTDAVKQAGVTDVGLIIGIDFTMSNITHGTHTFGGRSLHDKTGSANPYQEVICILGETLQPLDDDGIIPAFGFGDSKVMDTGIFPLLAEGKCRGFGDVLKAYNATLDNVDLSGPTNFAPLIEEAISIVKHRRKFHILVIIADGQVTRENATIRAIQEASEYPLSVVTIGVGDGPWAVMADFQDKLPDRKFDNFHFVDFHRVKAKARNPTTAVAVAAMKNVIEQYKEIKRLGLLEKLQEHVQTK